MQRFFQALLIIIFLSGLLPGQWQQQPTNLPDMVYPSSIDAVDNNVCWAAATKYPGLSYLGYIKTIDGGVNWICDTIFTTTGMFNTICAIDANTAYVSIKDAGSAGRIFKTSDGGNNWIQQNAEFTVINDAPLFIHFFDLSNGAAIGARQGNYFEIFITSDAGNNWDKIPDASMPVLYINETIFCDDYAFAGNSIWFLTSESRIFRSTDKGLTWTFINSPQSFSGGNPNIAFENENTGLLLANWNSLWKTTNGGLNWTSLSYSGSIFLRYMCYVPGTAASYMLASQSGSVYTLDCGNSFTAVDSSSHFALDFSTPYTGWANGSVPGVIFKWAGQPLPIKDKYKFVNTFSLDQNYPNPFNPVTTIKYSIPAVGTSPASPAGGFMKFVQIKVYDVLGKEVANLVNGEKPAGTYQLIWNAANMPSGVYFYRIKAGDPSTSSGRVFVQTKKMILLK